MKKSTMIAPALVAALCLTTSAWAGGANCGSKSEASAKEASAAGKHCAPGTKGASMASGEQCKIGANNAVFSFAVPEIHCGSCVDKIEATAMEQKGVLCAKVNLDSKMAYVAGDRKLNQKAIAKAIKNAGYECKFVDKGPKARAELMKIMAANTTHSHAAKKDKV